MKHFFLRILCGRKREKRKDSKSKEKKQVDEGHCACCLAPFLISRGVRCNDCGARACRKSCSRWDTSDNAWNCIFCHQRRAWMRKNEKWFENFGSTTNEKEESQSFFGTAKSQVYIAGHAVATNMEQIQEDQEEKHVIRNFVEKIVEDLVENVNDTSIDRLYKNSEYDKFLEEHRPPLIAALTQLATCLETSLTNNPSMDPPATAHAALKEIVEKAVEEARKLPGLGSSTNTEHPREDRSIADHSYEDLLATAILNKVVEKFQRERVDGNSNVLHDTDLPKAKYTTTESEHGLEENAVSCESYHRECNGNRSTSIRRNGEPVSFMMEEQIEEVTTITSDDDEFRGNDIVEFECTRRVPFPELGMDIIDPPRELSPSPLSSSDSSDLDCNEYSPARTKRHVADRAMDLISPVESWEDNWLFQKKKTSRTQPDAVSMLVPSSNAYYKALIGDRDAEDTSDLSECSSTKSDEEIEKELMEAINNVVPRTPRTSECDAKNNSEVPNVATQFGNDEIGVCQAKTKIENLSKNVCERFDEKINEKLLRSSEISEKKIIKDESDKEKLSESSFTLITVAKGEDKAKEKPKDTTDCGERIILVESSAGKNANTQVEKSSERNDRSGNVADENEERESEYTEHYDTAIQRHLDSLTKVEVCSGENEMTETCNTMNEQFTELKNGSIEEQESERSQTKVQLSYVTTDENHIGMTTENDRLSAPPRPGTIAEREHKKWENAPPIENNPYSEESIRKRCLERQYSKNSDIPGVHYDLTKLNEVNLEALLAPDRPDIKRFGRDYYINQSKAASGEQQEQAIKSTMSSVSSRPSSSLSQRSSCTGDEQREQQVSHHKLEQFEAASLRDSLPRQRCRDPLASAHFAINPLLHLKLTNDRLRHDDDNERIKNVTENDRVDRENMTEDTRGDRGFTNFGDTDLEAIIDKDDNYVVEENLEIDTNFEKLISTDQFWSDGNADHEVEEPIVPRYDANRGGLPDTRDLGDHDSGIGSRDSVISDRNRWRRLYRMADNSKGEQISSIGGRRFWTTGGYKYHTFGGIKIRLRKREDLDDLEDESTSLPEEQFADCPPEFAKLKFQTFGGIKRSRKIDGSKIPNYRRIRLRPILLEAASAVPDADKNRDRIVTGKSTNFELYSNIDHLGNFDHLANLNRSTSCSTSFEGLASFEDSTNSTLEESDWQDEQDEIANDRVSAVRDVGRNRTSFKTSYAPKYRNPIRKRNVNSSSLLSLENEDDEWQDEIDSISNESIMNKFLNDISKRRKIDAFSDDNVARRGRETRSRRHREILEDDNSRKLDKLINRNTRKSLDNSKKLRRMQEQKGDDRRRKLDVTSLSDVTIWKNPRQPKKSTIFRSCEKTI
ncbi:uncharacterized protein LOC114940079 isoform X4 [Nylanderia fulva]|uniref:uncharacterized protein LOC114940079 isoform X4 n=2 Tax=Nylanderia fulva TaxID=613905 RepID=UPI0010FB7224|nr:uncharacterized protein LOC114940079 isoform X4 [Nylanderia fulva]XP_029170398.1 uncharacterized protein LOC114940079 isoform X4 [Nylanderia fulva]